MQIKLDRDRLNNCLIRGFLYRVFIYDSFQLKRVNWFDDISLNQEDKKNHLALLEKYKDFFVEVNFESINKNFDIIIYHIDSFGMKWVHFSATANNIVKGLYRYPHNFCRFLVLNVSKGSDLSNVYRTYVEHAFVVIKDHFGLDVTGLRFVLEAII